MVLFPVTLSDP